MAQENATIEVEHAGETVKVPRMFERSDLAAWFGNVPDEFEIDRIYIGDHDLLEADAYLGDGEWVSLMRQTEDNRPIQHAQYDIGWVADLVSAPGPEESVWEPGQTVWER